MLKEKNKKYPFYIFTFIGILVSLIGIITYAKYIKYQKQDHVIVAKSFYLTSPELDTKKQLLTIFLIGVLILF